MAGEKQNLSDFVTKCDMSIVGNPVSTTNPQFHLEELKIHINLDRKSSLIEDCEGLEGCFGKILNGKM